MTATEQPDVAALAREIGAIEGRAAGTDAERRTARIAARALRAGGRRAIVQTVWVRPAWGAAYALCAALGVAGSVVSPEHPRLGLALAVAAIVLLAGDVSGRLPLIRRLTRERATQNVVAPPPGLAPLNAGKPRSARRIRKHDRETPQRLRLVLVAALDTPRAGFLARHSVPAPLRILLSALGAVALAAGAREAGAQGTALGVVQLIPTAALILLVGGLLEASVAEPQPRAGGGADVAAVVAVAAELDARPPRRFDVEVVLAGAGSAHGAGMTEYVRACRRSGVRAADVVVVEIGPCAGPPRWWTREGALVPLGYHPRLIALAAQVAAADPTLAARATAGATAGGARAARAARWPAIRLGRHEAFTLALIRALDREL